MPTKEFVESVDSILVGNCSFQIWQQICWDIYKESSPNVKVFRIIARALRQVLALARLQNAERREGTMTFMEAMDSVVEGKLITRPGWSIVSALVKHEDDGEYMLGFKLPPCFRHRDKKIMRHELDNLDGNPGGEFYPYNPSNEDILATDWMIYEPPIDIWLDLQEEE